MFVLSVVIEGMSEMDMPTCALGTSCPCFLSSIPSRGRKKTRYYKQREWHSKQRKVTRKKKKKKKLNRKKIEEERKERKRNSTNPSSPVAPTGTPSSASPAPQAAHISGVPAAGAAPQFLKHKAGLQRSDLDPEDPVAQFHAWFSEAADPAAGVGHPETCTLSTAALPSGRVSARMVYMKELDAQGFVVYSNFDTSGKARDLLGKPRGASPTTAASSSDGQEASQPNAWVSLVFWWEPLERQVRVEGRAARLPASESQAYFDTRVRGSRIGAWASRQSAVVRADPAVPGDDGRAQLDAWVAETEARFAGQDRIPVPDFWGGLRVVPETVEFWQGRDNRLHDRFVYERVDGKWTLERLSP